MEFSILISENLTIVDRSKSKNLVLKRYECIQLPEPVILPSNDL
jgi:hypothetical protein